MSGNRLAGALGGAVLALGGLALLVSAFAYAPGWQLRNLGPQWQAIQAGLGAALLGVGAVGLVVATHRRREPLDFTPAHVSFTQRVRRELEPPPPAKVAAPKPRADPALQEVNRTLREVNLKLQRASVMLGTGKLTREGYANLVADLRAEKGRLEAERTRLEMAQPRSR